MSEHKTGEIEWNEIPEHTGGGGGRNRIPYLKMKDPGEYRIRVVSKPHSYYCHWVDGPDGSRRKVNATLDGNDPIVLEMGKGPQNKWLVKVLFRNPETKKTELALLDAGQQIISQIKQLHESPNYGPVHKYDVIIRKGKPKSNPLYTVNALMTPDGQKPLTDEEKKLVKESKDPQSTNYVDVDALTRPWTAEEILAVIEGTEKERDEDVTPDPDSKEDLFDDEEFIDL